MSSTANSQRHIPLASQVGGHAGVMTSEDGSIIIKPALPVEVNFYQSVASDPGFAPLRPFIPKFLGTLRLAGEVDESTGEGDIKVKEVNGDDKDSIVLENLTHSFSKPNILDIKLGTVLHDDSASAEKRARMEKTAQQTTSLETGVRLTGFQVYDLNKGVAVNTPKEYGKSIKPSDLPNGFAQFFPIATSSPSEPSSGSEAKSGSGTGTGLPPSTLAPILESLREDIVEIREAFAEVHLRMVGGSLLVIYEADWERAKEGLKFIEEGGEIDEDEDGDDDDDEEEEEEGHKKVGSPYIVKMIDFAHTQIVPGQGPDEGVLKGLDTVLRLIDGRLEQVKAAV